MLNRVLEVELMDTEADARDYDQMDHSAVNAKFAADFLSVWSKPAGVVLDVGTGTALIPIELCRRASGFRVRAIDAAEHMLKLARSNIARAGLMDRIAVELVDAKKSNHEEKSFDAVVSNSIVHHIPEPLAVLVEMVRACKPGGTIFVRDLARPLDLAILRGLVDKYAAGANEHQRQLFADSLHAALTVEEVRDLIGGLGFSPETVAMTSDRHWTWTAVRP